MRALLATLALLILGAVAFARLPMDYLPRQSFPELTIGLRLPDARDPEEVTRDWLVEIESAVRSLGRVRGTDGQVRPDGAEMRVRFTPGTDPGRKAARLEAELSDLRRRLPARHWIGLNDLLVAFGQNLCHPTSPHCTTCPVASACARVGVRQHR